MPLEVCIKMEYIPALLLGSETVSYTHLDVYKRQIQSTIVNLKFYVFRNKLIII